MLEATQAKSLFLGLPYIWATGDRCCPYLEWPFQLASGRKSLTGVLRGLPPSWMTLDLVKLTTDSDHDIPGQFQSPSTCPPPPHPLLFLRQLLGDSPGTCGPGSWFCVSVTQDRRKATPGREGLLWLSFRGFLTHCEGEGMAGPLGSW